MEKWSSLVVGSIVGGLGRYALAGKVQDFSGAQFPYGTLAVNLSAAFLIGILNSLAEEKFVLGPEARMLLMTGFCGAYSTFSTLMLETSNLLKDGEFFLAFANYFGSGVFGFVLFRIGALLGKTI